MRIINFCTKLQFGSNLLCTNKISERVFFFFFFLSRMYTLVGWAMDLKCKHLVLVHSLAICLRTKFLNLLSVNIGMTDMR